MTEGYRRMTADLDEAKPSSPILFDAPADEVLTALQFGMTYSSGKNRKRHANEIAIKIVAQMIYDHLALSGYVIKKEAPGQQNDKIIQGYKGHLTE
jgi:hypothetical protein